MDLLPDTQNCGLRMRRERFSRHRHQRKPLVSDPGMHHGTCVTHVPWCMSGSLTSGGGENVPGIPGACATRNFTYLARGPWTRNYIPQILWDVITLLWLWHRLLPHQSSYVSFDIYHNIYAAVNSMLPGTFGMSVAFYWICMRHHNLTLNSKLVSIRYILLWTFLEVDKHLKDLYSIKKIHFPNMNQ